MLHSLLDFLHSLTDPERLIQLLGTLLTGWLGYAVLFGLVFAETGMLVGFFLPGDSLLFTVGVVCGAGQLDIALVVVLLICAAMLGDTAVAVNRTFAAFVAGVGRMNLVRFLSFDIFGVTGWVVLMTLLGYKLGGVSFVRHNFEKVILGIVAISLVPAGLEVLKARRRSVAPAQQ